MNLRNCPECGKVFLQVSRNLCPECVAREEKDFELVAKYVRKHTDATVESTSEATGVSEARIIMFLREGRLQAKGGLAYALQCDRCGKPIGNGRLCEQCAAELVSEIQSLSETTKPEITKPLPGNKQKYHTADRYKK